MELLTSWKEISSYLGRTVRTAQRWERKLQLPIHRPRGRSSGIVWAFPAELNAWLRGFSGGDLAPAESGTQPLELMAARQALDSLPVPAYLFDAQRHYYILANKLFCDFVGYSEDELTKLDWRKLFSTTDADLVRRALIRRSPKFPIIWRFRPRNGSPLNVALKYQRIRVSLRQGLATTAFIVVLTRRQGEREQSASQFYK